MVTEAVDLVSLDEYAGTFATGSAASELMGNRPMRLTFEPLLFVFFLTLSKFLFGSITFLFNLFLIRDYRVDFLRGYNSCSCHDYSFLFCESSKVTRK